MSNISNITQMMMRSILLKPFEASGNRIYCARKYVSRAQEKPSTTVDDKDVEHLSNFSYDWWDINGSMKLLHSLNPLRVQFVRDGLANLGHKELDHNIPLQGVKILEVGCGGGIFSESLARAGANVVGIDPSKELLNVAKEHSLLDKNLSGRLNYINTTIEDYSLKKPNEYDVIVSAEMLEHVHNPEDLLKLSIDALKPGGSLFVTTVNRTFLSFFFGIIVAEYILRLIPPGTHSYNKFITPTETRSSLEKHGCQTKMVRGFAYNPINNRWRVVNSTAIEYGIHVIKIPNPASKS